MGSQIAGQRDEENESKNEGIGAGSRCGEIQLKKLENAAALCCARPTHTRAELLRKPPFVLFYSDLSSEEVHFSPPSSASRYVSPFCLLLIFFAARVMRVMTNLKQHFAKEMRRALFTRSR